MFNKKNDVLPETMVNQITTYPKIAYRVKYAFNGKTTIDDITYEVTDEQKQLASEAYPTLIEQFFKENKGKLIFEGAGSSFLASDVSDVGNYRIRCHIINPMGRKFYIELGGNGANYANNNYKTHFDHVIDRDMKAEYNAKLVHYMEILNAKYPNGWGYGTMRKDEDYINYKKYQEQPYYWYRKELWYDAKIGYNKKMIITMVNEIFDCNFTEMIVESFFETHTNPDGFASISN